MNGNADKADSANTDGFIPDYDSINRINGFGLLYYGLKLFMKIFLLNSASMPKLNRNPSSILVALR